MVKNGKLFVITGCMKSGKSTLLYSRLRKYMVCTINKKKKKVLIIRPKIDTIKRTHNGEEKIGIPVEDPFDLIKTAEESDVIGIDEGSFMKNIVKFVNKMLDLNKIIIVAGLDLDYKRKPFHEMCELMGIADKVTKLKAVCESCGDENSGIFSFRTSESEERILIGSDDYISLCRNCFKIFSSKKIKIKNKLNNF